MTSVRAFWDDAAGVWVVESDDVPGLITEVARREDVLPKVAALIAELDELNGTTTPADGITIEWNADRP